jgi:hypothetical protein
MTASGRFIAVLHLRRSKGSRLPASSREPPSRPDRRGCLPLRTQGRSEISGYETRGLARSREEAGYPGVFPRGSAVHAYWVERCVGFTAVNSDGRRLGRVRRVARAADGTTLIVAGRLGNRSFSSQAVQSVSPRESVIFVSQRPVSDCERDQAGSNWRDETLPWFELLALADTAGARAGRRRRARARASIGRAWAAFATTVRASSSAWRAVSGAWKTVARWSLALLQASRERLARLLFRLARAVEPGSSWPHEDTAELASSDYD